MKVNSLPFYLIVSLFAVNSLFIKPISNVELIKRAKEERNKNQNKFITFPSATLLEEYLYERGCRGNCLDAAWDSGIIEVYAKQCIKANIIKENIEKICSSAKNEEIESLPEELKDQGNVIEKKYSKINTLQIAYLLITKDSPRRKNS